MALFGRTPKTVALIDIGSSSIGGGYATLGKDGTPRLHYATRVPIELHERPMIALDMLKALGMLGNKLINEGAPQLRKVLGSGKVDTVLASIGSPWQETSVRSEIVEKIKPFTFTKAIMNEALANGAKVPEGRVPSGELVVATLLNGYETKNPFGKRAQRAELVVLSSTIDRSMAEGMRDVFGHLYHTRDIEVSAFAPIAYSVLRDLYPHEKDFLVMHVSGEATDLALVKRGILVDVASITCGVNGLERAARKGEPLSMTANGDPAPKVPRAPQNDSAKKEWLDSLANCLKDFSKRRALPRTVFLLADEEARAYLTKILDDQMLHSLWLSDEPLTIIPSLPQHLSDRITCDEGCEKDLFISMLALSVGKDTGIEA